MKTNFFYTWISGIQDITAEAVKAELEQGLTATKKTDTPGNIWAVKLNLTYPRYLPGVVNSPIFVEGLCQWANDHRITLIFLEGDGGNGSYSAQNTFDANGVSDIAKYYDMKCVSLSTESWEWRETEVDGHIVRLPYSPFFRRKEYDRFITAPLFKNHIFTIVSLGMKNLWGCIPDAYRMYYHHILDAGIVALYKELQPDFSIFDGLIALRGRGPMDGKPLQMNLLMVSSDVGVGESAALRIMGIPLNKVRHLQLAHKEGLMPLPEQVQWLSEPQPFQRTDFILDRSWLNYLSIWVGQLPRLQRVIYHSPLSYIIYKIVDRLRPNSAQAELVRAKSLKLYSTISIHDR